ncbi:MAG: mandelate racemase/muconate lactonizing enzyme family protein [Caldilineaceae bacterium]|nr:mandelate racemase/muconate lactonizing enzyme family protein [Caldilineaceae bacterium]
MKIQSVESFTAGQRIGLVRVRTEDGSEGWGQFAPTNVDITAMVLHRQVAPVVLGMEVEEPNAVSEAVMAATYKFPGTYVCRALAGVDTAIWDLLGKVAGKSVCELLGGTPRPFPVYGSSMRRETAPEELAAQLVRLRDAHGYQGFKVKIGKRLGYDVDEWPGRTESVIRTVRAALGDEITLLADGNSGFTPKRAIEVGRLMEEHQFSHLEEPCPYWELAWTAEVAAALGIPVAGGEQDYDLKQWERILAMQAVDICQPDICYLGGLSRTLQVARMAEAAGLRCVPHSSNHSLVTVFTLHMMGALANAGPYVEFSVEPQSSTTGFYAPRLGAKDGKVQIPEGPGWGITIDPHWLAQCERLASEC